MIVEETNDVYTFGTFMQCGRWDLGSQQIEDPLGGDIGIYHACS